MVGIVVMALDLRLEIAGSIPSTAMSSTALGKLLTRICLCHKSM